jgi:hypothetical protein
MAEETILLPSTERIATVNAPGHKPPWARGMHLVVDVTAITDTPSVVPKIQGFDQGAGDWYDILVGAAITGTGKTVLKIAPGLTAAANLVANDILPERFRAVLTHDDADPITYSVTAVFG